MAIQSSQKSTLAPPCPAAIVAAFFLALSTACADEPPPDERFQQLLGGGSFAEVVGHVCLRGIKEEKPEADYMAQCERFAEIQETFGAEVSQTPSQWNTEQRKSLANQIDTLATLKIDIDRAFGLIPEKEVDHPLIRRGAMAESLGHKCLEEIDQGKGLPDDPLICHQFYESWKDFVDGLTARAAETQSSKDLDVTIAILKQERSLRAVAEAVVRAKPNNMR